MFGKKKKLTQKKNESPDAAVKEKKDEHSLNFAQKELRYVIVEKWLDHILEQTIPSEVVALNFNLYDDGDYSWSMELVGASRFSESDEDWCCDEVFDFGTREEPFRWNEESSWDDVLQKMMQIIKTYLEQGQHADVLKNYQGVGIGFVDGNIEILYVQ